MESPVPLDVSLVIACYNEEPVLQESMCQVFEVLDTTRYSYEVIFVDDCSQDGTRVLIDSLIAHYPEKRLKRIFHERNIGRGGTVSDGIRAARGCITGFIDIDLETHARYIPSCISAIDKGADVVTIHRVYKFHLRSIDRYLLSRGYVYLVQTLLGLPLNDTEAGFKFFNRERILPILSQVNDQRWFWDTEILARSYHSGLKVVEIPALFMRRFDKQSTVHPFADSIEYFKQLWRFRKTLRKERLPL